MGLPKGDDEAARHLSYVFVGPDLCGGANGVVMASNDVMHQKNCVHANVDQAPTTHDHAGHSDHHETSNDAAPEHDHNTCMMHACSAVVNEAYGTVALPVFLSSAQRAPEIRLDRM